MIIIITIITIINTGVTYKALDSICHNVPTVLINLG